MRTYTKIGFLKDKKERVILELYATPTEAYMDIEIWNLDHLKSLKAIWRRNKNMQGINYSETEKSGGVPSYG